ncbi:hypothetical protein pb186bvf_020508 [Paramecium bursaria]
MKKIQILIGLNINYIKLKSDLWFVINRKQFIINLVKFQIYQFGFRISQQCLINFQYYTDIILLMNMIKKFDKINYQNYFRWRTITKGFQTCYRQLFYWVFINYIIIYPKDFLSKQELKDIF